MMMLREIKIGAIMKRSSATEPSIDLIESALGLVSYHLLLHHRSSTKKIPYY